MPGQSQRPYTEVTKTGWGTRIGNSIQGIVFGLILFIAAFGVLFWNEGRVDKSEIAANSTTIDSSTQDSSANGKLINTYGILNTTETLGDEYIKPGDYIALIRTVEMYAWEEKADSNTKTNIGGSQTTTTTYTYKEAWTTSPADSSNFSDPNAPSNPTLSIKSEDLTVGTAKVGIYDINPSSIAMPGYEDLELAPGNTVVTGDFSRDGSKYLYKGRNSVSSPRIGDIRISYQYVPNNVEVTAMGKLNGSKIEPFIGEKNSKIYLLSYGTSDEAVAGLAKAHSMSTWLFRVLGFVMMWWGLSAVLGPISVVLDVLPFLGSISRGAVSTITFITALILSAVTILVSMILHSILAVIVSAIAVIIAFTIFLKGKAKKKVTA